MNFLQVLALSLQLADGLHTCNALHHGMREANPVFGSNPTCGRILAVKGAFLVPTFVLPKGKFQTAFAVANIAGGGIGVSVSIYNRSKK